MTPHRARETISAWGTEAEARAALQEFQQAHEAGRTPPAARTLRQLADEYLVYKERQGKRSIAEDRRILTSRLLLAFGPDLPVKKLTAAAIGQYEQQRAGEVSAFTVSNELGILRHMLRLARRWGYLEQVPDVELPKKPEGRQRYLESDEIAKLLDASAKSRNPYLHAIVTLAVNSGMRKSELLGLEWERVNLSTSAITLYRTKSNKPRGVPINRAVYDALVGLEPDPADRAGLVFKRRDGAAWGQIRTAFTSACAKAGIKAFRFHDLRHTAASHMVMRGASLQDVKEILGHSDFKMTLRYAHLSPAHLRSAVDRLDGLTPLASTEHKISESLGARA